MRHVSPYLVTSLMHERSPHKRLKAPEEFLAVSVLEAAALSSTPSVVIHWAREIQLAPPFD